MQDPDRQSATHEVVIKLAEPRCQPQGNYDPDEARAAVLREAELYTTNLKELQGKAVPRFFGLYEKNGVYAMVLERGGLGLFEGSNLEPLSALSKNARYGTGLTR